MITNIDQDDIKEYYLFHKEFYNEMKMLHKKLDYCISLVWTSSVEISSSFCTPSVENLTPVSTHRLTH